MAECPPPPLDWTTRDYFAPLGVLTSPPYLILLRACAHLMARSTDPGLVLAGAASRREHCPHHPPRLPPCC